MDGECFPDIADKYSYPVKKDSEEINKMTQDKRWEVSQIPDDVLKSISTQGLIRSFLDLPHSLYSASSYSSSLPARTWPRIYKSYNSSQELLTRNDAVQSLINYYRAVRLDCFFDDWWEDREPRCQLEALEYLFIQPEILDKLDHKKKVEIVKLLLMNYKKWENKNQKKYNMITVMVWIMYDSMIPSFGQETLEFLKDNVNLAEYANEVLAFAERFIK